MINKYLLLSGVAAFAMTATAQQFKEGYVEWGTSSDKFGETLTNWEVGKQVNEDDNFFISRVKPKNHFRNAATQVRAGLTAENDKKLIAWIPINNDDRNALPDGVFDSEVFNMWPYVTHYGNWTAPLGRVPGGFLDVAHKNGVAVSSVAGIPYGSLWGNNWQANLEEMVENGAEKTAQLLHYYGVDGLGYNSEFAGGNYICGLLRPYHAELVKIARGKNPLFENFWYDGTNDMGTITFDMGLGSHNDETFGDGDNIRTSLFLNYNWNNESLLSASVNYAKTIDRDPLDLYAGVNMQGAEPGFNSWPLLQKYPISIGLWGAHKQNMFWESRGEMGSDPAMKQRAYQLRTERWFTGGTRNPANCPEVTSSMKYNAENYTFHGMSSFMTARSSMKWNLSEEPFISYFNLGNGKFFNWKGVRQNDNEWYNIGVQDYLPTWRWWFASSLLGRNATDVPASGLDAEFTWDEAYVGGSTVRIYGTVADEYLHLFKTEFGLQAGDVITFRYKVKKGAADMNLVLTAKGAEATPINENGFSLLTATQETDEDEWVERRFTVGDELAGKDLALVALHLKNAADLDLYLGEFSIVRGTSATPAAPAVTSTESLSYSKYGVDGKIIFEMAHNKPAGEPCYNLDVKTSLFKLYAQQEGCDKIFMGLTTSWAGLYYSVPMDLKAESSRVRFGVSAVSLDMASESEISWGEYQDAGTYVYDDDIQISKTTIKPGEDFEMSYVDPKHESATWILYNGNGEKVYEGSGHTVTVADGLTELGSYDLEVTGMEHDEKSVATQTTRRFGSFVQITSLGVGSLPKILTLTANDKEADISVSAGEAIALAYTGRQADGAGSQGVDLQEARFGAKCADLGLVGAKSFSVAFWLKINKLAEGTTQLLAVANKMDGWPKTDWGWIWTNVGSDGSFESFTFRGTDMSDNNELQYKFDDTKVPVGNWVHLAYVFDYNAAGGFRCELYMNGIKQKVTQWKRARDGSYKTTEPGYESNVYNITNGQVLSIGGDAHGRSGIDGVIDNLQVWNKVMTAEDVKASMGDLSAANLPADVLAFWDLEEKAGTSNTFTAVGSKAGVAAGCHNYSAQGGEGQGAFGWIASEYTSGCPFISGTAFPVTTLPTWTAKKGTVTEVAGNDLAGTAKLTYAKGGDYTVTLTLANSLGADKRTYQVIKVTPTGIESVETSNLNAYTVGSEVFVEFEETGKYDVRVYNVAGQEVAARAQTMSAGSKMQLTLGQAGTYVLTVKKDGRVVRSVKLLRK